LAEEVTALWEVRVDEHWLGQGLGRQEDRRGEGGESRWGWFTRLGHRGGESEGSRWISS